MSENRAKPCWPTLIGTTIGVLTACATTVGYLLNQWAAPKEEVFKKEIEIVKLKAEEVKKDLCELEESLRKHKDHDEDRFKKIDESVDKYREDSEKRDKESKELMTEIQVILASLKTTTEYIKETVKELKIKTERED